MKVTLWRQFSSNHSSHFAIVGHFANAEAASKSFHLLHNLMQRLLAAKKAQWKEDKLPELSEPEEEIILTYRTDWYKNGMDWNGLPSVEEVVQHFQNDVFLMCPVETWDSPRPFEELLQSMGANSLTKFFGDGGLYVIWIHLTCKAPDEPTAKHFADHTLEALNINTSSASWKDFLWIKKSVYSLRVIEDAKLQQAGQMLDMTFQFYDTMDAYFLLQYLADNHYTEIEYKFITPEDKR